MQEARDQLERRVEERTAELANAMDVIRKSESRFRTLADVAPVGIYLTDTAGVCQFANRRWCEMAGLSPEEATGKGWTNALHPDDRDMVYDEWNRVMTKGGSWETEFRFVTPHGKFIWVRGHGTTLLDDDGRPIGYIGADIDITLHKEAEFKQTRLLNQVVKEQQSYARLAAVLQTERDILQTIMENTRTQLAYLDRDFKFVAVNSAYAEGCGHPATELIGRNHFDLSHNEENLETFRRVRDTGQAEVYHRKPFEYPDQPERGTTWWDWSLVPVKDAEGAVLGLVFSLLDVTDEVTATRQMERLGDEAELERRRLRTVLDVLPIGVILADATGRLIDFNPALTEIWGGVPPLVESPDEYQEYKAYYPGTKQRIEAHEWGLARAIESGEKCIGEETDIETFDQQTRTILNYALPIRDSDGKILGGVAINVDITQRKREQEALRKSEERLQLAQRLARIETRDWDISNDRLYWSEQVSPMLGLTPGIRDTTVDKFIETVHSDDAARVTAAIESSLIAGQHYKQDHRVIYPDGSIHWVEEIGDVVHDAD